MSTGEPSTTGSRWRAVNMFASSPDMPTANGPCRLIRPTTSLLTWPVSTMRTTSMVSGVVTRNPAVNVLGTPSRARCAEICGPPPCTTTGRRPAYRRNTTSWANPARSAWSREQPLLIPIQCEFYALEGLGLLMHTLALLRRELNPTLRIAGIVMTLFDARLALAHQVVDEVRARFGDQLLTPLIPRNVRLSEAPSHGVPITLYDPTCRGAIAYRELSVNLDERIRGGALLAAASSPGPAPRR